MSTYTQISGIPGKRSRKTEFDAEGDHISNLPGWAISHILSRLPTKDAVRTSVLSRDWEFKWTSIYNIHILDMHIKSSTFVDFVERTLLLSRNVQSFRLMSVHKYELSRMKTWISAALSRDLHCLQILYSKARIVLPRNLLNCYSLRELTLSIPCTFKVPSEICFPHITTLHLEQVEILNELSNSDLVKFNFPVMETFTLKWCKWLNVKFVEIYAPKMTMFTCETPDNAGVNVDYSIKITGDSLVRFNSCGDGFLENIVLSGSAVVFAALKNCVLRRDDRLFEKSGLRIRKLLEGFSSLKDLELSGSVAKAIFLSKLEISLPKYHRMERLVLQSVCPRSFGYTETLFELLHAAPFLKVLHIGLLRWADYDYDAEEYVPSCIVSHLEEVKFTWFYGAMNQFKLVKFFLKNALQLKIMRLLASHAHPLPEEERYVIAKELCAYPKASASLTILNNF